VRRAARVGSSFPITAYDQLTAGQVKSRLADLAATDLRKIRTYEQGNKARKGILAEVERRLGGGTRRASTRRTTTRRATTSRRASSAKRSSSARAKSSSSRAKSTSSRAKSSSSRSGSRSGGSKGGARSSGSRRSSG
jgi:hypothetical protein